MKNLIKLKRLIHAKRAVQPAVLSEIAGVFLSQKAQYLTLSLVFEIAKNYLKIRVNFVR